MMLLKKFFSFKLLTKNFPIHQITDSARQKERCKTCKTAKAGNELMYKLTWIDFNHMCNLLLLGNDKALWKHQKSQNRKFGKLSKVFCESVLHDPDKVI